METHQLVEVEVTVVNQLVGDQQATSGTTPRGGPETVVGDQEDAFYARGDDSRQRSANEKLKKFSVLA